MSGEASPHKPKPPPPILAGAIHSTELFLCRFSAGAGGSALGLNLRHVEAVTQKIAAVGGQAVEGRLDALQRAGAGLGGAAGQHNHVLHLGVAGGHIALAQAGVDKLPQLLHHNGGLRRVGVLAGRHRDDGQENRQAVAHLHTALHAVNLFKRFKVSDAGTGVLGVGQGVHKARDLALTVAVGLTHLAVGGAGAARLNGVVQAAHSRAAAGQILRLRMAAQ